MGISIGHRDFHWHRFSLRQNAGSTKIWIRRSSAICVTGVFSGLGLASSLRKEGPFLGTHPLKTIFGLHICGLQRSSRKVHIILGPWSKLKSRKIYRWTGIAFWCTHFQPCPCYCRYLGTWAVSNDYTTFQSQDWIPNKTHIQTAKLSGLALAIPTSRLIFVSSAFVDRFFESFLWKTTPWKTPEDQPVSDGDTKLQGFIPRQSPIQRKLSSFRFNCRPRRSHVGIG